ncbi:MAG: hypothetical protein ACRYG6_07890 [Janthinobacterium lividum]
MQDRHARNTATTARRAVLCALSVAGVLGAAIMAPALGWPTGLGLLGVVTLVLVVILLAAAPDDDAGAGASDPAS